jgi:NAD(P)-dependent dehydrogenase (short-subunit alcohol dehydrogenase family)
VSSNKRIALVTGANRGIGFEICRQLAQRGLHVVLTSRDAARGEAAAGRLRKEGFDIEFRRLDVASARSIRALASFIGKRHGRLDVLVNNAGVLLDPRSSRLLDSEPKTYRATLDTNFFGPLMLTQALVPFMQKNGYGRVVNLSSGLGQLAGMGTGTPAYRISKTALNALTRILAAELKGGRVLVNSMCPGWVKTRMGGPGAPRTVARGADTAVWLATLPAGGPTGGFFRDRKRIAW